MFKRFLIWCDIHRRNKRVKLDISDALKRKEVRSDSIDSAPRARPLIVLEEDMVERQPVRAVYWEMPGWSRGEGRG